MPTKTPTKTETDLVQTCDEFLRLRDWFGDPLPYHVTENLELPGHTRTRAMTADERRERNREIDRHTARLVKLADLLSLPAKMAGLDTKPIHELTELRTPLAPDNGFEHKPEHATWAAAALTVKCLRDELAVGSAADNLAGFVSKDTLRIVHGIVDTRLSEAASAGLVKTRPAPRGWKDSQGRRIVKLYREVDAVKHCSPKYVKTGFAKV